MTKKQLPYGTWPSDLTAEMVAGKTARLMEPSINQNRLFWLETRPNEKGRVAIMLRENNKSRCILPNPLSVKSKVHEYGGGAYCINKSCVYFVLADDQQIYFADFTLPLFEPKPLTNQPGLRFADLQFDSARNRIIAVCEDHSDSLEEPVNSLVSIDAQILSPIEVLHRGYDFYSFPRISPNGNRLAWNGWNHPNMPWDNTELWLSHLSHDGQITHSTHINRDVSESIFQPQWSPDNQLFFVSDRNDWWNIYTYTDHTITQVTDINGEFATPQWTFNMSTYGFLDCSTLIATYSQEGTWHLCKVDIPSKTISKIACDCVNIFGVTAQDNTGYFLGSTPMSQLGVYQYSAKNSLANITETKPVINSNNISTAEKITFQSNNHSSTYAFYYAPKNAQYACSGEPPVIVICHGGPTGSTNIGLELKIQFWTTRGFAVLDVNYRGSTGYGRKFRQSLHKNWGAYDIEDVCAATEYVIAHKMAHPHQCIIKGSSAGGYTVLSALTFADTFHAGVSLYGIGDLKILIDDTHKFEARYLDSLIGEYDSHKKTYFDRSPINFTENLNCPILIFQGTEDRVVPPNQAKLMAEAVDKKSIPVSLVLYENEGHGFRNADNIIHMLKAELEFYQRVFKLSSDNIPNTLTIKNLND